MDKDLIKICNTVNDDEYDLTYLKRSRNFSVERILCNNPNLIETTEEFSNSLINLDEILKIQNHKTKRLKQLKNLLYIISNKSGLTGKNLYLCAKHTCNEQFDTLIDWQKHMAKIHSKSLKGARYACPHCRIKPLWLNVDELSKHFDRHGQHKYFCYFCGESYLDNNFIEDHIKYKHSQYNIQFKSYTYLIYDNEKNVMIENEYHIVHAINTKISESQFIKHMIQTLKTKYQIDINDNDSESNDSINNKILPSTSSSSPKSSKQSSLLLSRKVLFESKIPVFIPSCDRYCCSYCTFKGQDGIQLERHIKELHSTFNKYKCLHCNYECETDITKFNLIRLHWLLHSTKIYACIQCTEFFVKMSDLLRHMNRIHVNQDVTIVQYTRCESSVEKLLAVCLNQRFEKSDVKSVFK